MDRRLIKPSVKRCLFGRPVNDDGFLQRQKQLELEEKRRFKLKWSLDSASEYEWTRARSDIPQVYTKPYCHKSRRRPVRPCVGKCLSFAEFDDEDIHNERPPSPEAVQYCDSDTVAVDLDVFIGILPPRQPPQIQEQVTPKESGLGDRNIMHSSFSVNDDTHSSNSANVDAHTSNSANVDMHTSTSASDAERVAVSNVVSSRLLKTKRRVKRSTQKRLTDMYKILKRRPLASTKSTARINIL